jgi:hypothetical protein
LTVERALESLATNHAIFVWVDHRGADWSAIYSRDRQHRLIVATTGGALQLQIVQTRFTKIQHTHGSRRQELVPPGAARTGGASAGHRVLIAQRQL